MIAVIGDIHGCFNTLKDLVSKIKKKYPSVNLYCVGDLVDRGNFSYEVMEFIIRRKIKFTPGNHDYMFYYFIKFPKNHLGRAWLYNGYETTLASYNNRYEKIAEHIDLITSQPLFINNDDCFISHAGISVYYRSKVAKDFHTDPNSLKNLIESDIDCEHGVLWTRDKLLNLGKLQVVGHTRQPEVLYIKENNTAYIDTSVYTGNKLSAVIVEKNKILEIISIPTYTEDIE